MPRVIITVPERNAQPYRFQLDRKTVSLGRGSDNDIVIDSGSVSGKHAEMKRVEGGYELIDLGSTNGIKVDGLRYPHVSLRNGMSARLGDVSFDFSLTDDELEIISREKPVPPSPVISEAEVNLEERRERKPEPKRVVRKQPVVAEPSGGGLGMIVLFFILASGAFYAGMSIRHQKETGESLLRSIVNKATPASAPAEAAPAPASAPAPAPAPAPAAAEPTAE